MNIPQTNDDAATDVLLVSGVADGNPTMAEALYRRCREQFVRGTAHYGGINSDDKGDLLQDSFIILWKKIEVADLFVSQRRLWAKGRHGTGEVPDLMGYFMRIVRNKYLESLRTAGRLPEADMAAAMRTQPAVAPPDEGPTESYTGIVTRCLMMLPRRCQELIDLFYVQGLSLDDIIRRRGGLQTYQGLKTAKYKCLKSLRERVRQVKRGDYE